MSTPIYVIGIIAWILYNFYKAGKKITDAKKPVGKNQHQPASGSGKEFSTVLEEILAGKKVEQYKAPESTKVTTEKYVRPVITAEEIVDETISTEDFFKKYKDSEISIAAPPVVEEVQSEWIANMDVRKAIVYAEIFKRPVY